MRLITTFLVLLYCLSVHAQTDTLKISTAYTTHIIFSTDITYADLSNNRIVAAKIGYSVISISKLEFPTNEKMHSVMHQMGISCIENINQVKCIMEKEI